MKLLKSSIWSFLSVGIRGISALSINKMFAISFGPSGLALLSHFQNLIYLSNILSIDGINRGLVRFLSPKHMTLENKQLYFTAGLILNTLVFLFSTFSILFLPNLFLSKFEFLNQPLNYFILSFSVFLLILDYFILSIFNSFKNQHHYFIVEFISSTIVLIMMYLVLKSFSIEHSFLFYVFGVSIGFFVSLILFFSYKQYRILMVFRLPQKKYFSKLSGFILMAVASMVFEKMVDFFLRDYCLEYLGKYETGIWQGVVKISDYYMMGFTSVLMISYFPQISSVIHNLKLIHKTIFNGVKLYGPIILVGVSTIYIFRDFFITVLLSKEFLRGSEVIHLQLIGDTVRMFGFLMSLLLLAQAKLKPFILGEFLSSVVYISVSSFFIHKIGIEAMLYAHITRFVCYFIYLTVYFRKTLFFKLK